MCKRNSSNFVLCNIITLHKHTLYLYLFYVLIRSVVPSPFILVSTIVIIILTISGRVTYRNVRVTCSWTRSIRPGVPEVDIWCRRNARLEPSPCWLLRSRNVPFQMSSNPMWGSWARTSYTGNPIFWCRNASRQIDMIFLREW